MQRQEMIAQILENLQESTGQGASAKFRLNYLLNKAVDDIAAKYKCCWGTASGNLVNGTAAYPAPTITNESSTQVTVIEVYAVTAYDALGNGPHTLQLRTSQGMDSEYAGWRLWLANECPIFAVTTTTGGPVILTPAPNYNSNFDPTYETPGGFTIEGVCLPALSWAAQTAECPLPTQAHDAAVLQACMKRVMQNPTKDNLARLPLIKEDLRSQLDTLDSSQIRYTQATRVPAYTTGDNAGGFPSFQFNPLDQ